MRRRKRMMKAEASGELSSQILVVVAVVVAAAEESVSTRRCSFGWETFREDQRGKPGMTSRVTRSAHHRRGC
jgi:hypothetical protein